MSLGRQQIRRCQLVAGLTIINAALTAFLILNSYPAAWIIGTVISLSALAVHLGTILNFNSLRPRAEISAGTQAPDKSALIPKNKLDTLISSVNSMNTERRARELALIDSDAMIKRIYRSVTDGIVTMNSETIIMAFNPAAEKLFGYRESEIQGKEVGLLISTKHRHLYVDAFKQYIETGKSRYLGIPFEAEGLKKDGTIFPLELCQSIDGISVGSSHFFTAICRDISPRKQVIAQQRKSQDLLAIKFSITKAFASPCTMQEQMTLAIGKLLDLKCLTTHRTAGLFLLDENRNYDLNVQHGEFEEKLLPEDVITCYEAGSFEISIRSYDETSAHCFIPLLDQSSHQSQLLGVLFLRCEIASTEPNEYFIFFKEVGEMITEALLQHKEQEHIKHLSSDAQQSELLKNQFIATMGHEVRTPMNHILGMLSLLLRSELTQKQRRQAELADDSARTLLELVNDVLDLSRLESGKFKIEHIPFDISILLENFVEGKQAAAEEKHLQLLLDTSQVNQNMVVGDPSRLRKVLNHLLNNAIKFTHQGSIEIHATLDESKKNKLRLKCIIKDTGIGIAASKQASLFSKFTQVDGSATRAYGGTGIGLAICKNICELMEGNISVQSQQGSGSAFEFNVMLTGIESDHAASSDPLNEA